jgi:SAM-dependent methyltransferase
MAQAVNTDCSVIIATRDDRAPDALSQLTQGWATLSDDVNVVGAGSGGLGTAIRGGLAKARHRFVVLQDASHPFQREDSERLLLPLRNDAADAVFGRRPFSWSARQLPGRALGVTAGLLHRVALKDPFTPVRSFRAEALQQLTLTSSGEEIQAEIVSKLSANQFRVQEVELQAQDKRPASPAEVIRQARALLKFALSPEELTADHEGYNTLLRMEAAPNYNAWLGRKFKGHLGKRVLEVGAGIGTISRILEPDLELLVALEVEAFYVERLKMLFRGKPHVRPYLSDVSEAAWEKLAEERFDSIVLSNVLEHIDDDGRAVRNFRRVLQPGGKLLLLVPALPRLYGAMDEAVGHHRRYTEERLRDVIHENGFVVETLEWMNLAGVPAWFFNGRILRRRTLPPLQLRLYDTVAPLLAAAESRWKVPVGMTLFAVARAS